MPAFNAMPAFSFPEGRRETGNIRPPAEAGGADECGHITLSSRRKGRGHP